MYDPKKPIHKMRLAETTDEYHAFVCETPGCGRRVIYSLVSGSITVISEGDPEASHPTLSIPTDKRISRKRKKRDTSRGEVEFGTDNDPYLDVFKDYFNGH